MCGGGRVHPRVPAYSPHSDRLLSSGPSVAPPPSLAQAGLIEFTAERQRHVRFVGREDVLSCLDRWLLGPEETGWVVVTGGPGMGKSAILSTWLARREAAGAVVPHHFVRRQVADWDQPEVIAASLAAQLEQSYPTLRDPEAKPERRLLELLGRVSKQLGPSGRLVVLVDGLNETRAEPGDNPLPGFLPHVVPSGIRFLCATRPTYPHLGWIEARTPARRLDLDDGRWAASNEEVVRGFWEAVAREYQPPLQPATVATAIARAEGNVLHAVMLHEALRDLPASERRADRIPRGIKGLIGEVWDRAASHESVRVGLGLLCAAQEAVSLDVLVELAEWSYDEMERFLREARQLLLEEPASWDLLDAYRPRHDWVRELMAGRLGAATLRAHHATLARGLATWPTPMEGTARRYALRHALIHHAEAREWAAAWRLAADMEFIEVKCRELGAHEAEVDVARTAKRARASRSEVLCRRFDDLARALARESHWLRSAPEATAALVWNRLRRWGWSADEIDQQLRVPAGATFLRTRHAATRENPALVRDLVGHSRPVNACAVTPDGRRVISASADHTLMIWDLDTGRALAALEGHSSPVLACAVIADGRRVVSVSADKTLKVWDLDTGRELATLVGHSSSVLACAMTPDGRRMVSISADQMVKIWDLDTGRAFATLVSHAGWVNACAVTPDGRRVVSASWGKLKAWGLDSGHALATLERHPDWVNACAVLPDGWRVVSASWGKLNVWDLDTGRALATLEGRFDAVPAFAVMADGRHMVLGSADHTLKVWDLDTGRALATLTGHTDSVRACAVTPDGRRVVSASDDHTLKIWDLDTVHAHAALEGHDRCVNACAMTPDGLHAISASSDHTLKVWDTITGRMLATLTGHTDLVWGCTATADGRRVVSASADKTLKVWDLETGRTLATLAGHTGGVLACAMMPEGKRVVSASTDDTLKIWDLDTGRTLATLTGHRQPVNACAVTADGRRVISASADKMLKVWSVESRHVIGTLEGHTGWVLACAVTPDGRRVVSASDDHTLKVWDLDRACELATLKGHAGWARACAVTADGRHMVTASDDKTLKVWDLATHDCLLTHRGDAAYMAVAVTATTIVAGDVNGAVWFLDWHSPNRGADGSARGR